MTTYHLNELKQVALKNRIWYIGAVVISAICILSVMLFFQPTAKPDNTTLQAKEKERHAMELQAVAFQQLIIQQARRIEALHERDSLLLIQSLTNYRAIKSIKIKTDESIKRFSTYGSAEWSSYFANLPEPER